MSVEVSYKKQTLFGFMFLLLILSIVEISARVYDFYYPNCRFTESDVLGKEDWKPHFDKLAYKRMRNKLLDIAVEALK